MFGPVTTSLVARMTEAAGELLASCTPDQRSAIVQPFAAEDERRSWFYTPTEHGGLALAEMDSLQQQQAFQLLAAGLSPGGYTTAALLMNTENLLDRTDGWFPPKAGRRGRDPLWYKITIFGSPGADRWGWRIGGHHLSLHYTVVAGRLRATPHFFGIDPATSPLIGGYTFRPLAGLEDIARELVRSLAPAQQGDAVLSVVAPFDLVTGNRPHAAPGARPPHLWEIYRTPPPQPRLAELEQLEEKTLAESGMREEHLAQLELARSPKGLSRTSMTARQQAMLDRVVEQYLGRLPDEFAASERDRLAGADHDLHFAWAGATEPGQPHYYRVQGERLLLEYDSFHRDGGHVHSVWRDPAGDFGADILAHHLTHEH